MAKKRSSLRNNRPGKDGLKPASSKTKRPGGGSKGDGNKGTGAKHSNHSLNPERKAEGSNMRSKATINRLRMYKNFKPIRNSKGKIVKAAPFQAWNDPGTVARVEPHRKWFGNTRVLGQEQLQKFQEHMGQIRKDPFQVVMRQTRMPVSLLQESAKQQRVHIVDTESFEFTFGKKSTRKKPKLNVTDLQAFIGEVEKRSDDYKTEGDRDLTANKDAIERYVNPNPLFRAGQSNRVWGELYKVIDSSDVVVEVIDARDPMGTRCKHVEEFMRKEKPHKHLILLMNKVDLVPNWVAKRWLSEMSKEFPTIVFHASIHHSFGKGTLIHVLRQFAQLHKDRQQISVGFIGYPNVGKSSIVNTLRQKKVCKTAPLAGETKVWQYVTLMERIFLIDCPGVVYPQGDTETDIILKGVVRVENVDDPEHHVQAVIDRVRPEHLRRHYKLIPKVALTSKTMALPPVTWTDADDFMTKIALASGRLLKGGEPDFNTVAKMVLSDFQRGNLPHYVLPPGCQSSDVPDSELDVKSNLDELVDKDEEAEDEKECEEEVELDQEELKDEVEESDEEEE